MLLNDLSSPLALLLSRRTAKAKQMVEPGPDDAQLRTILTAAMRVPDHGKLFPWRFVTITKSERPAFAAMLLATYRAEKPDAGRLEIEAIEQFARQAPALVVVISSPKPASHIPLWEQQLSAGAACQTLLLAAHASGFAGCWLTGWATYSDGVRASFGCTADERIAGFLFLGTAGGPVDERPRPDYDTHVSPWLPTA